MILLRKIWCPHGTEHVLILWAVIFILTAGTNAWEDRTFSFYDSSQKVERVYVAEELVATYQTIGLHDVEGYNTVLIYQGKFYVS